MSTVEPLVHLDLEQFHTTRILHALAMASRQLAQLKGIAMAIPNQGILINALGMLEAKESSEIENIVTSLDDIFQVEATDLASASSSAKEVMRYRQALQIGFQFVQKRGLISLNDIVEIQSTLECNNAGFRKLPGTVLKNSVGKTVYTPPQDPEVIVALMADLELFMNTNQNVDLDPLIKMALIHHQFESIHPFYDGNGRTGRILNVLYLVQQGLLDSPVLYMSQYILKMKSDYYMLLRSVRETGQWEDWVVYMLRAVEETARDSIVTIEAIRDAMLTLKHQIRDQFSFYSQDLINNLFTHPYTKVQLLQGAIGVSRITATKYLQQLTDAGYLEKNKIGRSNYYVNTLLVDILKRL